MKDMMKTTFVRKLTNYKNIRMLDKAATINRYIINCCGFK